MKKASRIRILVILIAAGLPGSIRQLHAQASARDSLRLMLTYFYTNTDNQQLKKAVKETEALCKKKQITDSASRKLLQVDALLQGSSIGRDKVFLYAQLLVRALEKRQPYAKHPDYAYALDYLAGTYETSGNYRRALLYYQQALDIKKNALGEDHANCASSFNNLARIYYEMKQYGEAEPLYQQALKIFTSIPGFTHQDYAYCLIGLADLYKSTGAYKNALSYYQQALEMQKKVTGEEHRVYVTCLTRLATLYIVVGEHKNALPLYEQAVKISKKIFGENSLNYAYSLSDLSSVHEGLGQYEKAITLIDESLSIQKKIAGEENFRYTESLKAKGRQMMRLGKYAEALPVLEYVVALSKKAQLTESPYYGNTLSILAFAYENLDLPEKALVMHQRALEITEHAYGKEHYNTSITIKMLANLYVKMAKYEKAVPLLQRALMIDKKVNGEENASYVSSLYNIANLYRTIGQNEKAMMRLQQDRAIAKRVLGEEHSQYAMILESMALSYQTVHDYDKAIVLEQEALETRKKALGEKHPYYAFSLNVLADLYESSGNNVKALSLLQQAAEIRKNALGPEHTDYAASLNSLAGLYGKMGKYDSATLMCNQALAIRRKILGEQHPDYAGTLNNLGLILNASGNYHGASPLFIKAADLTLHHLSETYTTLSELEKMSFLDKQEYKFNYLFSMLMTYGKQAEILKQVYTYELTLKGMVLEDQLNVLHKIRQSRDSSVRQLFDQWHMNKKKISQQLLLPIARRAPYLDSLQEAATQQEQELSRHAVGFKNPERGRSVTAADVSQKLRPGQASIEFVRFQLYNKRWTDSIMYAAMILKPGDSACIFIPLCEEKQLKRLTGAAAIRTSGKSNDSLYKLIWKPLEKHLSGIHAIYYAPAGLLHRIAFHSLRCDPSCLLIDKYQLNQVLSTRVVAFPVEVTPKPALAAVWGNIDYGVSVPEIMASRDLFSTNETTDTTTSSFNFYADDTRGLRDKEWPSLPGTKKGNGQSLQNIRQLQYQHHRRQRRCGYRRSIQSPG